MDEEQKTPPLAPEGDGAGPQPEATQATGAPQQLVTLVVIAPFGVDGHEYKPARTLPAKPGVRRKPVDMPNDRITLDLAVASQRADHDRWIALGLCVTEEAFAKQQAEASAQEGAK
jgi:hypothetical protein